MLEFYLIILYLYFKWRLSINSSKIIKFPWNWLWYTPDLIQVKEVQNAIQKGQKWSLHYSFMIYTHLKTLLKDKTIVQIQMYGLGSHWHERCNGAGQLAVALHLFEKFKADFPNLQITSQDPNADPAEIEYQEKQGIKFYKGEEFCSKRFTDFLKNENVSKVKNPVMIFYAIHLPHCQFEKFLQAHWDPRLLSQIIFVSNSFEPVCNFVFSYAKKAVEFSKFCTSIPLPQEPMPPPKMDSLKQGTLVSTFFEHGRKFSAFGNTDIHTISLENAKQLINRCS